MTRPHLAELTIHRFRHLTGTPVTLRFTDGFNVFIGPNATGKTTLLHLVRATLSGDFSAYAHEAFEVWWLYRGLDGAEARWEVRNQVVSGRVERLVARATLALTHGACTVTVEADEGETNVAWTTPAGADAVRLAEHFNLMNPVIDLVGRATYAASGAPGLGTLLALADADSLANVDLTVVDEALDGFRAWFSPAEARSPDHPAVSWTRGDADAGDWSVTRFPAPDHLEPTPTTPPDQVRYDGKHAAFLAQWVAFNELHAAEVTATASLADDRTVTYDRWSGRFWLDATRFISEQELSFGQKRLLFILMQMDLVRASFVADELVNGLHHEWVQQLVDALWERQCFFTAQDALLLDHLHFEDVTAAERTFVLCGRAPGNVGWTWRQLDRAGAEDIEGAYKTGRQDVSKILNSRGLR